MLEKLKHFLKNESGQGLVEYVILVTLMVIVVILIITHIGGNMKNRFNDVNEALE